MKTSVYAIKSFIIGSLMLLYISLSNTLVSAQPTVIYTCSGAPGGYLLDFTVENTTPVSQGFDLYFFGVYVNGSIAGSPPNYNSMDYTTLHTWSIGDVSNWPFNITWIDPTYAHLFPGSSLSNFHVFDTDATQPTSVQFFAWGENNGKVYTGPGNHNASNPSNPFFVGDAVLVPEPSIFPMAGGAFALLLFRKALLRKEAI